MPLTVGTIYLFGQILSFALPVSLLLVFAYFFTRQARKLAPNPTPPSPPNATSPPSATSPAPATDPVGPEEPAAGGFHTGG